jgi:two-component system sensor histidine kinase BarA
MLLKNIGLKYQLRMTTLIPMFVVALLFAFFYNAEFNNEQKHQLDHLGEAYIRQLLPAAQWAIIKNDKKTLQGLIDASLINQDIQSLAFYDAEGKLLAYRGGRPQNPLPLNQRALNHKPSNPYNIHFVAPVRIPPYNLYSTATAISAQKNPDPIIGWIAMNLDTTSSWVKQYKILLITVFTTIAGLLIGLLIHYFLTRRIYRPISKLRQSMKHILNGAVETPIRVSSPGELGVIESGCAYLQQKVVESLRDLNQHVETATSDLQQSHELLEEKNIQLMLDKRKSEEKHKQKSALISNMSHEIRTPMNGIIGFANLLMDCQLGPLEHDYAKTIRSSAQDLLNIINDILDYSKIDACKLQLDAIPLDIRACIDDVLTLTAPKAHKKGLDLIPSTAVNVPQTLLGDPLRLKQIITNLVDNAIKFTEQGYVLIRTRIEQETDKDYTLSITITDTGIGITPEEQATLFQPFHQADSSIPRRYGGSGLGLIISKQLAEQMNGRLTLCSEANQGTTFTVSIKLEKLMAYEIEKSQTRRFSHITALCFDENPLHLEALCHGLGYFGVTCIQVTELNQLEPMLRANPACHLAFISVNPGCEGALAPFLTQALVPCILLSKSFLPDYEKMGARGFLFKPPNIQKLQETITAIIDPSQAFILQPPPPTIDSSALNPLRRQLHQIKPKLLIADDNPVNRRLYASWLTSNARIELVDDGEQAIDLCHQQRFDVILLDLQMPKLNGLLAAQRIRDESHLNQRTPIFLISANQQTLPASALKKQGIDRHLTKPIDEQSLLTHLLSTLAQTQTTAIDWSLCVQKMSGNEAHAREFFTHFISTLQQNRAELVQLMNQNNYHGLESAAHKLYGACCYFGAPTLQCQVATLENQAKLTDDHETLSQVFHACLEHIDNVLNESISFFPHLTHSLDKETSNVD